MTFKIEKIKLKNFRSYKNFSIEFDPSITILYGPNAIGKTNLIEALQLVTEGISFRNPSWEEIVSNDNKAKEAEIKMYAQGDKRIREVEFKSKNNKKVLKVNNKIQRSISSFSGVIPSILFIPQDLLLISSSSEKRREELDNFGCQLSKKYAQLRQEYRKILLQRNRLLKEEVIDHVLLEVLSQQLVEYGSALIYQRVRLLKRLFPYIKKTYEHIDSREILDMFYVSKIFSESENSCSVGDEVFNYSLSYIKECFKKQLSLRHHDEIVRRHTLVGPHRDDLIFTINNNDARVYGSQGQIRSITLAWKIAEVYVCEDVLGNKPLLLLDDVMSELDEKRRDSLTHLVGKVSQTIITTANIGYFTQDLLDKACVINVQEAIDNGE